MIRFLKDVERKKFKKIVSDVFVWIFEAKNSGVETIWKQ